MNTRYENGLNKEQFNSMPRNTDKKSFILVSVVLILLLTFSFLTAAWIAVNPPPYELEYARSSRGILPEFVEGNTQQTTPGLMSFTGNYGTEGFTLGGEDSKWFEFMVDPEDTTKVFRVQIGMGDLGVIHILKWEAINLVVEHVLVKGGNNYFAYNYPEPFADDMHLLSPRASDNDQNIADISHFTVIFTDITDEAVEVTDAATDDATDATTAEATTAEATDATTAEATTAEATDATTAEAMDAATAESTTAATIDIMEETLPLAGLTTAATTAAATIDIVDETLPLAGLTTDVTTSQTTIVIDEDEEIPQTGENTASVVVGSFLLAMAGSMIYILRKVRSRS